MFSSRSPFYWAMEESYRAQGDVIAMRGGREEVERKMSVVSIASEKNRRMELEV